MLDKLFASLSLRQKGKMDFPGFRFNSGHKINGEDGEHLGFGSMIYDLVRNVVSSDYLDVVIKTFKAVNPGAGFLADKALQLLRSVSDLAEGNSEEKIKKVKSLITEGYELCDKVLEEAGVGFTLKDIIDDWKAQSRGCWATLENWAERDSKVKAIIPVVLMLYYSQEGINTDLTVCLPGEPAWKQILTTLLTR